MKIIREAKDARIACLGQQKIIENENYRPLTYTTYVDVEDGFLVYNNLTDELIFLSKEEKSQLDNFSVTSEICKTLIEKWYFVPENFQDSITCDQLDSLMGLVYNSATIDSAITKYTIFTTTECNARCFYCYEKDVKKIHMTDEVARDTADFIIKHSKGEKVTIRWFGGEPLYNSKVIDIICEKLKSANVEFVTTMISNGYLFNEGIIKKAKELWNLVRVQITLDGTEEVYNKIKAFIYPNENAFKIVLSNIEKILDSGIHVAIRMNMDNHNYENLFELVNFLCEKFKGYKNLSMYSQTLFDESSEKHKNRTDVDRDDIFKNNKILNDYIKGNDYSLDKTLKGYLKITHCMADSDYATTITPEGNLGKCEHYSDKYFWGSIYSDKINQEYIDKFKKKVPLIGKCDICPVKPGCLQPENCPNTRRCNPELQIAHIENLKKRILGTYNQWKIKN